MRVYPLLCAALVFSTSVLDFVKSSTTTSTTVSASTSSTDMTGSTSSTDMTGSTSSTDMTGSTSSTDMTGSTSSTDMTGSYSSGSVTSSSDGVNMTSTITSLPTISPSSSSGSPPVGDNNLKGATVTSIAVGTSVAVIIILILFIVAISFARRKRQRRRDSTASILTGGSGLRNTATYRVSAFENMMADPHCVIELDEPRASSNGSTFNPDNLDNPNNHDDHGPGDEHPSPLNPSVPGDQAPPRNDSVEDLELPPKHDTMRVMSFGNNDGMQPRSWIDTAMGNSDGFGTEHPGVGEKSHDGGEKGDGMIGETGEKPDPANDEARDGATEDDPECDYVSPSSIPAYFGNGKDKDDAGLGANDEQGKADDLPDPFPPLPAFDNDRSSC